MYVSLPITHLPNRYEGFMILSNFQFDKGTYQFFIWKVTLKNLRNNIWWKGFWTSKTKPVLGLFKLDAIMLMYLFVCKEISQEMGMAWSKKKETRIELERRRAKSFYSFLWSRLQKKSHKNSLLVSVSVLSPYSILWQKSTRPK